jgi:hypothetical protein
VSNRHIVQLGKVTFPFAVLIPSRGRTDVLAKTLKRMPFLDSPDTIIGYEVREHEHYGALLDATGIHQVSYANPEGSVAVARENLRQAVVRYGKDYRYVVVTDDNARYTREALYNLVATAATLPHRGQGPSADWNVVAGMHGTAAHFDRGRLHTATTHLGFRSYQQFGMIFQCYPISLYEAYSYPPDAYGLDDRHLILWLLDRGLPADAFRVAMDAPFTKARYMTGGQGTTHERAIKCGKGIARLAADFPLLVGAKGTFPIAWQTAVALRDGKTVSRLAGGAMRKESKLVTKKLTIRRRT